MSRATAWKLADVIDLEYLLAADEGVPPEELRARDRAIAEGELATSADENDRRRLLRQWLEARRRRLGAELPGRHFTAGWELVLMLAMLGGVVLGGGLTASLLHYHGREPLNAPLFFAATAGVQLLLLALGGVLWLLRGRIVGADFLRPLHHLVGALISLGSTGLRRLSGEQRIRVATAIERIRHRGEIYGRLVLWPLVIITQSFAVCFNLAVLATLLGMLHFMVDLRFGWQSTREHSAQGMYAAVHAIAVPWSAIAPRPHPLLDEVKATRFAPGQSYETLPAESARAWWPFLAYSVAVYGLLIRAVLLAHAASMLRRSLAGLRFDHAECNSLLRRLRGPAIEPGPDGVALTIPDAETVSPGGTRASGGTCVALLAKEWAGDEHAVREPLIALLRWDVQTLVRVEIDLPGANGEALGALRAARGKHAGVAFLVPQERAPVTAIASVIEEVKDAAGDGCELVVVVTAKGFVSGGSDRVPERTLDHWRNFLRLHRLRASLETLPPS